MTVLAGRAPLAVTVARIWLPWLTVTVPHLSLPLRSAELQRNLFTPEAYASKARRSRHAQPPTLRADQGLRSMSDRVLTGASSRLLWGLHQHREAHHKVIANLHHRVTRERQVFGRQRRADRRMQVFHGRMSCLILAVLFALLLFIVLPLFRRAVPLLAIAPTTRRRKVVLR